MRLDVENGIFGQWMDAGLKNQSFALKVQSQIMGNMVTNNIFGSNDDSSW